MRLLPALTLSIGIICAGALLTIGLSNIRKPNRVVTVKGLAERDVRADLALWPIRFVRTGDNLVSTQQQIDADTTLVSTFLSQHGLNKADITSQNTEVVDRAAQAYGDGKFPSRFIITRTLIIRSHAVDKVQQAWQATPVLISQGVILSRQGDGGIANAGDPVYLFNGLNQVKPAMIADATRNARTAARQFANDTASRLGEIQTADQGVIQILPQDKANLFQEEHLINKTVRVVVTLQYQLNNHWF